MLNMTQLPELLYFKIKINTMYNVQTPLFQPLKQTNVSEWDTCCSLQCGAVYTLEKPEVHMLSTC